MKLWRARDLEQIGGRFEVIKTSNKSQLAIMNLAEGEVSSEEMKSDHPQSDQVLLVLEGGGSARVGDQEVTLAAGDLLFIPAGAPHQIRGPNKSLNVYAPVAYPGEK